MTDHSRIAWNRRSFLAGSAALSAGLLSNVSLGNAPSSSYPFCVFTKPFNSLSFDELAERIAKMGFDGIEAPIRSGGHIEPEMVEDKLPELHEALKKKGLQITVMTSDINDPDSPMTERVLRTAATLGVKRYRMKYFKYNATQSIQQQLDGFRSQCKALAEMNHQLGIQAVYQNHAGRGYCGASIWDLETLLDDISPDEIGVAYDIRHATVEGGTSWPTTWKMIQPRVRTVYVKDFQWVDSDRPTNVPLGEGRVSKSFFDMLKESGYQGPISLHEEYLDHRNPELVGEHLKAIASDFAILKSWIDV